MKHDQDGFGGNGYGEDGFDWMETLASAGIPAKCRDLSHLPTAEIVALLEREQQAGIALALSIGLPQEADAFNHPIPVEMSDAARADVLDGINATIVAKDQLTAVMQVIDLIPLPMKLAGPAPAFTVLEYIRNQDIADAALPGALLARAIALTRWRADHNGEGVADVTIVIEAASRVPVICSDGLPAFDTAVFTELVAFLADLPW